MTRGTDHEIGDAGSIGDELISDKTQGRLRFRRDQVDSIDRRSRVGFV